MEYNEEKVDEMTLALLYLVTWNDRDFGARAWKGFDWETMNRLYKKGFIDNPKSKAKSVWLTDEVEKLSAELFEKHFGLQ
ncbi:hypothetical protein H8E88_18700 [candidate division KSB1 bacterium]|nr:hypothetical protein [candidate division KSB1 bacterium]MBL7095124.1 hypothetical protein [candidate division KSB1 bacterium]